MTLAEAGELASIGSFALSMILALIKLWPDIVRRGGSMISRAILILVIIGIISAGVSLYASLYIKPAGVSVVSQQYYLVGKDGSLLRISGLDQYGLNIKKEKMAMIYGNNNNEMVPTYILSFKKAPSFVDITNQQGATTSARQINPNEYMVQFNSIGFGSPTVECDFKIQIY